jgi:hypothetical protein
MSEDITQRLAAISEMMMEGQPFNDGDFTDIDEAISEIERLREQLRLANIDATNNEAEANELRAERDEARRWICEQKASLTNHDAKWWAQVHTWDCFEREQGANEPPPESPLDRLARLDEEVGF